MKEQIVIMGIGNLLMSDDGVGVHAVRELAANPPDAVCVVDAGTDFLSALPFLESARRALVIDAVQAGGAPGTVYRLTESDVALRSERASAHAVSLFEARRLLAPDSAWPEITVLGVEPGVLDYGLSLSEPVAATLPGLVALARETVEVWRRNDINDNASDSP